MKGGMQSVERQFPDLVPQMGVLGQVAEVLCIYQHLFFFSLAFARVTAPVKTEQHYLSLRCSTDCHPVTSPYLLQKCSRNLHWVSLHITPTNVFEGNMMETGTIDLVVLTLAWARDEAGGET